MKWCCQVRWVAVELLAGGEAEASPLEGGVAGILVSVLWICRGREGPIYV